MTPEQRQQVVTEAWRWIGTPYHSNARILGVGVDCAQILCAVYEACGLVPHVDTGFYSSDWHLHRSEELYVGWLERYCVPTDAPTVGDIALFKFGRCYSHGAIIVNDGFLIHAYLRRGVILSKLHEEPLSGRPVLYWTLK